MIYGLLDSPSYNPLKPTTFSNEEQNPFWSLSFPPSLLKNPGVLAPPCSNGGHVFASSCLLVGVILKFL